MCAGSTFIALRGNFSLFFYLCIAHYFVSGKCHVVHSLAPHSLRNTTTQQERVCVESVNASTTRKREVRERQSDAFFKRRPPTAQDYLQLIS